MVISSIINKDLAANGLLNSDVLNQLENSDHFCFISTDSLKNIKAYTKNKGTDPELIQQLWESILVDAICFLKINDRREKLHIDVKEKCFNGDTFDKKKFIDLFNKTRRLSTYGIDELGKYFMDYIEFERVLYGSDKYYRDHVEHVINVWAIGIGILEQNFDTLYHESIDIQKELFSFNCSTNKTSISKGEILAMWTIIALCHDLGYPIEKASKVNKETKKILSHFGSIDFQELDFSFGFFNSFLIEKFINITSSKPKINPKKKTGSTAIQHKYRDKISKSLEDYRHGAFSGLLIFKTLTYFLETDYSEIPNSLEHEDLRQFYIRREILRSIVGHTCPKIYHLDFNTLPFLLILCDELQEWNRPRFDDYRTKVNPNDDLAIKILKYDTSSSSHEIDVSCEYNKIPSTELESLIKSKFKDFHHLLRSAKDDDKRNLSFKWTIVFESDKTEYTFLFDSNGEKDSLNLLKTTKTTITKEGVPSPVDFSIY